VGFIGCTPTDPAESQKQMKLLGFGRDNLLKPAGGILTKSTEI
jgi:hypothetical protein